MNTEQKLDAIQRLYEGYFNTDQDTGTFAGEFFSAVGEILSGKELKDLNLKFLILDEILTPDGERYDVDFWSERDRIGIWVTDTTTGKVIFEVWDKDALELFDDGFFKQGKRLKESVLAYLKEKKVI